jgi:hypothetical protein
MAKEKSKTPKTNTKNDQNLPELVLRQAAEHESVKLPASLEIINILNRAHRPCLLFPLKIRAT